MSEIVEDKATLRRLGMAVLAMCAGAMCLIVVAMTVGR